MSDDKIFDHESFNFDSGGGAPIGAAAALYLLLIFYGIIAVAIATFLWVATPIGAAQFILGCSGLAAIVSGFQLLKRFHRTHPR